MKNCDPKQAIGTKSHLDVEAVKALEQPRVGGILRERRALANRRSHLVRIAGASFIQESFGAAKVRGSIRLAMTIKCTMQTT